MGLPALMATDAVGIISTNDFAETVIYTGSTGALTVPAVIRREPVEASEQDRGRTPQRRAHVHLRADQIPMPRRGLDTISFPAEVGGSAVAWRVVELWSRDDTAVRHLLVVR